MVALVTASCGGSPSASESQRPVHFSGLSGVVYGSGGDGAVLANQSDRDRESWAPFARYLAENGLRVLAFDYEARRLDLPTLFVTARSDPFSAADTGAVAEARRGGARRGGARRVFLVGGSLGGAAVVAAAPTIGPPVDGVVSLSGETDIDALVGSHGLNALPVASRIRVPLLLVVSEQDPLVSPAEMQLLARRVRGPVRVLVRPGGQHGLNLLDPTVVRTLDAFYRRP